MLLDVETLAQKSVLTKTEMQDAFEYLYKLDYHPVAVKFFFDEGEFNSYKPEKVPGSKMTMCQISLAARFNSISVKMSGDNLICENAKTVLGFKEVDDKEIDEHVKYTADRDFARECLLSKPRLPLGKLKGLAMAPLAKAQYEIDVIFFVLNPLQAYHILNDYAGACKKHPLNFNHTVNSAVCGGSVFSYLNNTVNMNTMCGGSFTSGKTEKGEVNVFIPGDSIDLVAKQLVYRTYRFGGASMIGPPGQEYQGMDSCKMCSMIKFKDYH